MRSLEPGQDLDQYRHVWYHLRLNDFIEAYPWPMYMLQIFFCPIKISIKKVRQDSHAIHYTSEGNVTVGCMLFKS